MSVASLEARLNRLNTERRTLQNRQSGVEKAIKELERMPPQDADYARKRALDAANYLEQGTNDSIGSLKNIVSDIRSAAGAGHKLDHWEAKDFLNREVQRLKNEIGQVDQEIRRVKAEIQAAREAERAAAMAKLLDIL